ncbi:N-acetyltransferase [Streptomyces sp. NPDC059506]|uniref:N-acetyltransferase n=1 Tax=Streptomyces TaxID=1883 RepID=UPI000CA727D3|nr:MULTISPECIES: N-acetyltransferase [unclassified Streptomyces]MCZ2525006.1 N-acetyltransferase [Streptomyces sp. HB2AG]PLW66482.1 N-acetyltransferase [Streptomyces sp. DJ]QMV24342.1 N-acetyltransferase [Streptomyces sp. SCUT-3]
MPTRTVGTELHVASLAERPDLTSAMLTMESSWPAYIRPDPVLVHWVFERHAHHQLVVFDDGGTVVARAASVPLTWDGTPGGLPDTGWDEALRRCMDDTYSGREPNTLCAMEIAVVPGRKAQNLSRRALDALKDHGRRMGYGDMVAPVRPSLKHSQPQLSMDEYAQCVRPDGLPQDPWLRVHVRAGGQVLKVCPVSMTISGSLDQWRGWTGLPFDTSGPVEVAGALNPVVADVEHDHAVYIEPNVWVRHPLTGRPQDS